MEDVKQTKPSLEIEPALVDGFLVREVYDGTGGNPGVLFAGTLSHCLAFMESRMRPAPEIYVSSEPGSNPFTPDIDWSGVKSPDCTEAELEAAYREILGGQPTQDPNIHRAGPVDLSDLVESAKAGLPPNHYLRAFTVTPDAPGSVDREWDEGVVAATRAGGWTGNRWPDGRKTYPPETETAADRAYREALISTVSREGPALAVWLTPHDRATIITALRQQDAQNAGKAP